MREAGIAAAQLLGDLRVFDGKPFDVGFINDRLVPRPPWMPIIAPIEVRINHHRLGHERGAVLFVGRPLRIVEMIWKDRLVPFYLALDGARVRIEQQLGRMATLALLRRPLAMHAKSITLPGADVG